MAPLLSIVVPVYNTERQLSRCVESILKQDFDNYELILVNDGSTDLTPQICDRFASSHPHVSVIHKENSGAAHARNMGIEAAKGVYIYFVDSDDWIAENSLIELGRVAVDEDPDLIIFGYTKKMMTDKKTYYYVYSDLSGFYFQSPDEIRNEICPLLDQGIRFSLWNKFFKRSIIEERNVRFPSFRRGQDMAFTMSYFKYTQSMRVVPDRVYIHEHYYAPEKYSSDVFRNHLELFETFYSLFPDWMKKEENYRYAARLFGFWFFYQIPKIFILKNSKDKAMGKIRELLYHKTVQHYNGLFKEKNLGSIKTRFPLVILNTGNEALLYYVIFLISKAERIIKKYFYLLP